MFWIKTKKREKEDVKAEIINAETKLFTEQVEESAEKELAVAKDAEILPAEKEEKAEKSEKLEDVSDFYRLAEILCTDKDALLEECKLYEIRKIMSKISRAVVRYGLTGSEMKSLVKNAEISGLSEIAVSPAYLTDLAYKLENKAQIKVSTVVDFPFGEASFKVKLSEIKNSVKKGVDGVLTVFNATEINNDNAAAFKKQLRKIGRIKGVAKGVAVSGEDLNKDDIKRFLHVAEKAGFNYAAFLFGNVSESKLTAKMKEIAAVKGKIAVKVMANVENVWGVQALIKSGADGIITPYAERIAEELFTEFKIAGVKLS